MMKTIYLLLMMFIASFSFSQEATSYLTERENLYREHADIVTSDRNYALANGETFPALVAKEKNGNTLIFTYTTHRNLNDANRDRVLSRLKVSVPSIVAISSVGNQLKVSFLASVSNEDLMELFRLTGYSGYKIMNDE